MSPLTESTRLTLAKGQPVPNDPYLYTNTVLLLHGDGTNGSTNIVDSSKVAGGPKTVTANGNAQISTSIADPFGNNTRGVLAFDGNGDFLSTPNNAAFDFGNGDLTIEAWVYIAGNSAADNEGNRGASICNTWPAGVAPLGWQFALLGNATTTGIAIALDGWGTGTTNGTLYRSAVTVPQLAWNHVAATVNGGTRRLFLNGSLIAGTTSTVGTGFTQLNNNGNALRVGQSANTNYPSALNGYIDDLRITKGVARYTSNFTPPTLPFPDF
jgi:hypothetical protein